LLATFVSLILLGLLFFLDYSLLPSSRLFVVCIESSTPT
jgi:hypothetical protein